MSQALHQGPGSASGDPSDIEGAQDFEDLVHGSNRPRAEGSPSRMSFSSSVNQATPARSYFHHSLRGPHSKVLPHRPVPNSVIYGC